MIYSPISSPIRSAVSSLFANRGGFVPSRLFASGEQGAWYDPSDWSTLYQDSAGTTPVTAVEQPVGLMLDKSGRGNHATQTTSTSRPVLSARYNLLTKTEQFDQSPWTLDNSGAANPVVTPNFGIAPNGTNTATRIVLNKTGGTFSRIQQIVLAVSGVGYTFSVWLRTTSAASANVGIRLDSTAQNCVVTNTWQRFDITSVASAASTAGQILLFDSITGNDETADILAWGASLVPANQASIPYQRVNTATDYDADPAKFKPYLKFDGVDDFLVTNSIDFTATDKMTVFAGVRKLSDALGGVVAEIGPNTNTTSGVGLFAPSNIGLADYGATSRGTATAIATSAGFAAPVTSVLASICNISGDSLLLRLNGSLASQSTTDQGTGNYGSYPLYIGRRGGTLAAFNGYLYSLIVRGAQTSATQVSQTETWVNGRTGAY